jgi:hypothetical protein
MEIRDAWRLVEISGDAVEMYWKEWRLVEISGDK